MDFSRPARDAKLRRVAQIVGRHVSFGPLTWLIGCMVGDLGNANVNQCDQSLPCQLSLLWMAQGNFPWTRSVGALTPTSFSPPLRTAFNNQKFKGRTALALAQRRIHWV